MVTLEGTLQEKFSLPAFRKGQKEIIEAILNKKDVLAVLPTGGGKSLCYQLPALVEKKIVLVISPLIALMRDQVEGLTQKGIPAGCLHSDQEEDEKLQVFRHMSQSESFILYISPERAHSDKFRKWVVGKPIALFAIDEAHCVSQWGHDFREEYGKLRFLREIRPDVPMLALTASATPLVLKDIAKNLLLNEPSVHVHGFYRPNLYYQVESCIDEEDKFATLVSALQKFPTGRVIIYSGTRRSVEELAERLGPQFDGVGYYHAGLSAEKREKMQDKYEHGKIRILVATNAFGMGIDHPDVRLVVHFQMPANIDSLYQEMGRAGRDGDHSTCLLLYAKKDKGLQTYFIQTSKAPSAIKQNRYATLEALVNYAEGGECRQSGILTYYQDQQRIEACGHCDVCDPSSKRRVEKKSFYANESQDSAKGKIASAKVKKKKKSAPEDGEVLSGTELIRFDSLKDWRKQKAKELDVAAFMVFSDRTLRALARQNPQTKTELSHVYGVGEAKIEAFGADVLALLLQS